MTPERRADLEAMLRLAGRFRLSGGDQLVVSHTTYAGMYGWDRHIPDVIERVMIDAPGIIRELLDEIDRLDGRDGE